MKNLTDFVTYAKANPGKLTYGSGGHGTHQHMALEMFNVIANIKITHVPYKVVCLRSTRRSAARS